MSNIRMALGLRRSRYGGDPEALVRMAKRIDAAKTDKTQTQPITVEQLDSAEDAHRRRAANPSLRRR